MKKLTLLGMSKSPKESLYIFLKEQKLMEIMPDILLFLKFKSWYTEDFCSDKYLNGETDYKYNLIKKITDIRMNFKSDEFDMDLFFGTKRVILIIRSKQDKEKEISDCIFKFGDFKEGTK